MGLPWLLLALLAAAPVGAAVSPDGRLRWEEGDSFITVNRPAGFSARGRHISLPSLPKDARRSVVFARRGDVFAVLDEESAAVGLHLESPRGSRAARAFVTGAVLRLMDLRGRTLWTKQLPDTYAVGGEGDVQPLSIAPDGTAAILLQDVDPYTKAQPLLLAFDPKGRELLRLDYTLWSRVDELLLSDDGRWLAVRGIGRVPADETWSSALGSYGLESGERGVYATPAASGVKSLRAIDKDGAACCIQEGRALVAVGHDGSRQKLEPGEAAARFGLKP